MSMVATPAQPQEILPSWSDFKRRRYTVAELYEALDGVKQLWGVRRKLNADLHQNVSTIYAMIVRWVGAGNWATLTKPQISRDTGISERTVRECLGKMEAAGIIKTELLTAASGKYRGLRVELLPVNEMVARTRARSSAG